MRFFKPDSSWTVAKAGKQARFGSLVWTDDENDDGDGEEENGTVPLSVDVGELSTPGSLGSSDTPTGSSELKAGFVGIIEGLRL
mmetsp:Transcript_16374/g.28648  ORF Transcript_16374/g.28648 Transcript_16374/m.28648 type:complete len:84 (+) Transcript_16374:953-1204(+)